MCGHTREQCSAATCGHITAYHCIPLLLHITATAYHCYCISLLLHTTATAFHCISLHITATAYHCYCISLHITAYYCIPLLLHTTATAFHCISLHITATCGHLIRQTQRISKAEAQQCRPLNFSNKQARQNRASLHQCVMPT